jgi:DNA-binding XRE family transcriptional regulator
MLRKEAGIDFSNWIRVNMARRLLTQQELANRAGVSRQTIADISRGLTIRPKREIALRIQKVFDDLKPFSDSSQEG